MSIKFIKLPSLTRRGAHVHRKCRGRAGWLIPLLIGVAQCAGVCYIASIFAGCTQQPTLKKQNKSMVLLPIPRQSEYKPGNFNSPINSKNLIVKINPQKILKADGYRLEISPDKILITAHDQPGAFYAQMTLQQIIQQCHSGKLPCVIINDWPDFENRGVMLDVSRDKVPKMETLYKLVDKLAGFKINQFQLYTEHTFAYKNHETVWKNASPMTPEQIHALDDFCKERFIELVPNQNSFSHIDRWLKHPEYNKLAEVPETPHSLNPEDPDSIKLLSELYAELLPNFSSKQFNVGCDETAQLGQRGSSNAVAKLGKGRVYLNFLKKIHREVEKNGKTMQFWCDIVLKYPELVPELPTNIVGLIWGYEANEPYKERTKIFADAGIPFYVCPGTAAWNSLLGRTDMMMSNVNIAAKYGLQNGAKGLLMTEWGDHGHWQTLPIALPGFAYAAALSWDYEKNKNLDLPLALDTFVFQDKAGITGKVISKLGLTYKTSISLKYLPTPALLFYYYWKGYDEISKHFGSEYIEKFQLSMDEIDVLIAELDNAKMKCDDADLIIEELKINAALAKHAYKLGIAWLETKAPKVADIPYEKRKILAHDLEKIIPEYRKIWLKRNREGRLKDSTADFDNLLKIYKINK